MYLKRLGKIKDVITEYGWTRCIFDVDLLFTNNTPYINFWTWCILNDLVRTDEEDENKYKHLIWYTDIILSNNETLNQRAREMFEKLKIDITFERNKDGFIVLNYDED